MKATPSESATHNSRQWDTAPLGEAFGELLLAGGKRRLFIAIERSISAHLTCVSGSEKHEGNTHREKANSGDPSQYSVVTTVKCSIARKRNHQRKGHEGIVKECAAQDSVTEAE